MKKHLYLISGGLGKNIIFTSILDQLYEKHNSKICIEASFPKAFYNNPYVSSVLPLNTNPILTFGFRDHYRQYEEIHGFEPYTSSFLKKEKHIIEYFQKYNNLKIEEKLPKVYWDINLEKKLIETINKITPFILLQFSGGITNMPYDANKLRDYPYGQELINKIKNKFPQINLVIFGHDNLNYDNTLKINFELTLQYFILSKFCLTFISIDSALQHFASNERLNKKGIVLWGETSPEHFGYKKNINLISSTPHVVDIETDEIINQLKQII